MSENDNAAETLVYNRIDEIAERTRGAVVLIHHASKGSQTDKRVTDVGAGARAQSRAADCHLVLREHEEPGVVVLEAAVRSFAPVEPLALRWQFPLWVPDDSDPELLKGRLGGNEQRQADRDREGLASITRALLLGPLGVNDICRRANMGKARAGRLVARLEADGHVIPETATVAHNKTTLYRLNDSEIEGGPWDTDHQTGPPDRQG